MMMAKNARAALLAVALCSGAAAQADVLTFTGDATAIGTGLPPGSCTPQFHSEVKPGNSSGTSSLGAFGYTSNTCVTPGGPVSGTFAIAFATDGFLGTLLGTNSPTATTGVFGPNFTYTILSGTGRFLGSTGTFLGTGSIDARTPPSQLTLHFDGLIGAPAVPEPATWAMMLVGFAGLGFQLRRKLNLEALPHAV